MSRENVLAVASRNAKKVREIDDLLRGLGVTVRSAADFPAAPEVDETGTTFAENAALKATTVAQAIQHWTLADDSGLAVDALDGAPGVYSARYAGENATDAENNQKLQDQLRQLPHARRTARFVCCLAVADPMGRICIETTGECRGLILREPRGESGFGYDPLFLIPEWHRTFAELALGTKSVLSHRARAFYRLQPQLAKLLS